MTIISPAKTSLLGRLAARRAETDTALVDTTVLKARRAEVRRSIIDGETEADALTADRTGWVSHRQNTAYGAQITRSDRHLRELELRRTELAAELTAWRSELADVERQLKAAEASADALVVVTAATEPDSGDPFTRLREMHQRSRAIPDAIGVLQARRVKSDSLDDLRAIDAEIDDLNREALAIHNGFGAATSAANTERARMEADQLAAALRRHAAIVVACEKPLRTILAAAEEIRSVLATHPEDETLSISLRREHAGRLARLYTTVSLTPGFAAWLDAETAAACKTLGA